MVLSYPIEKMDLLFNEKNGLKSSHDLYVARLTYGFRQLMIMALRDG